MILKKAEKVLQEHGYVDVQFDSNAFQECVNRRFEEEYKTDQADASFFIQKCRLRNAPDDIKKLGFDEHEVYAHSHIGLEEYGIRALQIDDQYFDSAMALLKMCGYKLDERDKSCYLVRLS